MKKLVQKPIKFKNKVVALLEKYNPCGEGVSEDSIQWRILSTIFPDCWCCAGIRGICYGVVVTSFLFLYFGW